MPGGSGPGAIHLNGPPRRRRLTRDRQGTDPLASTPHNNSALLPLGHLGGRQRRKLNRTRHWQKIPHRAGDGEVRLRRSLQEHPPRPVVRAGLGEEGGVSSTRFWGPSSGGGSASGRRGALPLGGDGVGAVPSSFSTQSLSLSLYVLRRESPQVYRLYVI